MAETQVALMYATTGASAVSADNDLTSGASMVASLGNPLFELKQALVTVSLDIRGLTREQVRLGTLLTGLNVSLASLKAPVAAASGEPKSKLTAEIEQRSPPGYLQSAIALESAMARLRQIPGLGTDLKGMSIANLEMATDKRVAGSGASVVDLVQVEETAARSGIGADLEGKQKQQALLDFAHDAAINASTFGVGLKTAAEMLSAWQLSMKLDRTQGQYLADATHRLGNSGLKATAADIGSVVQQSGESAKAAGIAPEQTAALSAALLNADVDKSGAGATVKNISAALAKGTQGSVAEQSAWKSFGLEPGKLTDNVPDNFVKVLEALKKQPAARQSALIKTLFNGDEGVRKLLEKPEDVQKAFALVDARPLEGLSTPVVKESPHTLKALLNGDGGVRQWLGQPEAVQ